MASVRVIAGPDSGKVFRFHERLTFGRSNSLQLDDGAFALLTDPRISREHLVIYREKNHFYALDKFSSNGSYVEGQKLKPNCATALPRQAQINIGSTVLLFSAEERADLAREPAATKTVPPEEQKHSPSMVIDAQQWLEKLQSSGPQADARNLSRQIKAITKVSLALGGTTETGRLVEEIIRSLFEVFQNAENIYLFSYDEETQVIHSLARSNKNSKAHEQISNTIARQVINDRHAILIYDAMDDASYRDNESVYALRLRSVICAPLLFRKQILGLIYIDSRSDANRFSEEDLEILTGISAQIAVAMKNTDLYHDIQNLLEGFVSASVQVIEARDPVTAGHSFRVAHYADALANAVNRNGSGSLKHISLTDRQLRELRYASLLHDFGKVGVKEDILTKENKLFEHQLENIRMRFEYAKACRERHLYHRLLSTHETKYLTKHQLQERMTALNEQLQNAHARLDAFFEKIARYNKPNLTHSDMSELIAELYQEGFEDLNTAERPLLTEFEFSALQIPKGSLTGEERREIEMHVTHTFNFLNLIPWTDDLKAIPNIAHAHHEKLDGSGYPSGIKARDIPLQSRIMTIADIYDALTAPDRPYKNSVAPEVALDMLKQEAELGKLDRELVKIYIDAEAYKI